MVENITGAVESGSECGNSFQFVFHGSFDNLWRSAEKLFSESCFVPDCMPRFFPLFFPFPFNDQ